MDKIWQNDIIEEVKKAKRNIRKSQVSIKNCGKIFRERMNGIIREYLRTNKLKHNQNVYANYLQIIQTNNRENSGGFKVMK